MKKKKHEIVVPPDIANQEIGRFLRSARTEAAMPQTAVAEKMGILQNAVARMEAGSNQPTLQTMSRFAQALGLRCIVRFET